MMHSLLTLGSKPDLIVVRPSLLLRSIAHQTGFKYQLIVSTDKESNNNNLGTPTPRHQAKGKPGSQNAKPQPVEGNKSLPNIFVVSIISVFIIGSLLVLVLVVVRSSLGRREEAREGTNTSSHQPSGVVIEVMMAQVPESIQEHKEDTNEGDTASEANVRT